MLLWKNAKPSYNVCCDQGHPTIAPHSIATVAVAIAKVLLLSTYHTGVVRSISNTPPLLVLCIKQKSIKSKQSH